MPKLVYYWWGELNKDDAVAALKAYGMDVAILKASYQKYDFDEKSMEELRRKVQSEGAEYIFSFNYFPDISRVADGLGIQYVSWVYDAPHYTLESETLANKCNHIFLFDSSLAEHYRASGVENVHYCPLPAKIVENKGRTVYKNDICFVGKMYDGEDDQYGQIKYMPPELKGRLDAYINVARELYGCDLIGGLLDERLFETVKSYVHAELGAYYNDNSIEIFRNMMRRRVTMLDRLYTLSKLGALLNDEQGGSSAVVALYSGKSYATLPVSNMGYAQHEELPRIFNESRINLNISLRSILSGIPLRVMHILGAGGFVLTNYQADLERHFVNGNQLVWYMDSDDLLEKVSYYLSHDDERELVSQRGQAYARAHLTYEKLLEEIFSKVRKDEGINT